MSRRHVMLSAVLAGSIAVAPLRIVKAQSPSMQGTTSGNTDSRPPFGSRDNNPNPITPAVQEKLERGRQSDRQRKLIADTDRLLALATQLKADMDKTTKDQLSIDVIKKAEEIEKLAHNVKERMKG